jgi:hypothetical protein
MVMTQGVKANEFGVELVRRHVLRAASPAA